MKMGEKNAEKPMSWKQLIGPVQPVEAARGLPDWYAQLVAGAGSADPFVLAVYGGRLACTPGLAFLAGYQAALRALWPAAPAGLGAFCATENRKLRPADMATRWDGRQLNGGKDFVSAGQAAQWLLVCAREEAPEEPPRLGLFAVEAAQAGVRLEAGPRLPLVPDVPHARLRLEQAVGDRLPGDGWSGYVKPFRTLEDLYVLAALTAWLYGLALRHQWPRSLSLRLLGVLAGAAEMARQPAHEAASHLLLAALAEQFATLEADLESALLATPGPNSELWRRDRAVLGLAREARARRLEQALLALGIAPAASA